MLSSTSELPEVLETTEESKSRTAKVLETIVSGTEPTLVLSALASIFYAGQTGSVEFAGRSVNLSILLTTSIAVGFGSRLAMKSVPEFLEKLDLAPSKALDFIRATLPALFDASVLAWNVMLPAARDTDVLLRQITERNNCYAVNITNEIFYDKYMVMAAALVVPNLILSIMNALREGGETSLRKRIADGFNNFLNAVGIVYAATQGIQTFVLTFRPASDQDDLYCATYRGPRFAASFVMAALSSVWGMTNETVNKFLAKNTNSLVVTVTLFGILAQVINGLAKGTLTIEAAIPILGIVAGCIAQPFVNAAVDYGAKRVKSSRVFDDPERQPLTSSINAAGAQATTADDSSSTGHGRCLTLCG